VQACRVRQDGFGSRWFVAQRVVRPDGVVVLTPAFDQHLGFVQRGEVLAVERLVTQLSMEALIVANLPGTSRFDE
jgi:hypothetical protein